MKDNLWHIYDYDADVCDMCDRLVKCAIWQQDKTANFMAICGDCDEAWKKEKNLPNAD